MDKQPVKTLKVSEGKIFVSLLEKPIEPKLIDQAYMSYENEMSEYARLLIAFNDSFIEVSNPDFLLYRDLVPFTYDPIKRNREGVAGFYQPRIKLGMSIEEESGFPSIDHTSYPPFTKIAICSYLESSPEAEAKDFETSMIDDPVISTLLNMIQTDLESLLKVCDKRGRLDLIQHIQVELFNKTLSTVYIEHLKNGIETGQDVVNSLKERVRELEAIDDLNICKFKAMLNRTLDAERAAKEKEEEDKGIGGST